MKFMLSADVDETNSAAFSANPYKNWDQNSWRLDKLKQLIYDSLDPLIDNYYCLPDIPDYPNIGDQLIYEGEQAYLKRLNHKMLYVANDKYEDFSKIPKNAIILFKWRRKFWGFMETSFRIQN